MRVSIKGADSKHLINGDTITISIPTGFGEFKFSYEAVADNLALRHIDAPSGITLHKDQALNWGGLSADDLMQELYSIKPDVLLMIFGVIIEK